MTFAIHSIFESVQGEGHHMGRPAVFVRLAGCNLWSGREQDRQRGPGPCSQWCDTDFSPRTIMDLGALVERVASCRTHLVVLTGGEPSLQVTPELVNALRSAGLDVAIETNGTHELPSGPWVVCSPKLGVPVKLERCDELKVVIRGGLIDWDAVALSALRSELSPSHSWLMPVCGPHGYQAGRGFTRCAELATELAGWRVGVQAHKMWGAP